MSTAKLYAIGVGPGAHDLLTLRAVRALASSDVILAPTSTKNEFSMALDIARPHLKPGAQIQRLDFPMTRNHTELETARNVAFNIICSFLGQSLTTAFLTLGDPLLYSTFGYFLDRLKKTDFPIEIIPGITSFQAAAAKAQIVLVEGEESLTVISGIDKRIFEKLEEAEAAVILKVYRNYRAIYEALKKSGRAEDSITASFVEQENEAFIKAEPASRPPYMSLILSPKKE